MLGQGWGICDAGGVTPSPPQTDLAIVGAGIAGCSLVACLRREGWSGSITLLDSGRGAGGRAATRRSRQAPDRPINHGAPLFNSDAAAPHGLITALSAGGWIEPFSGPIHCLNEAGQIGPPRADGFSHGTLWQGCGGSDRVATGLLALAAEHPGHTALRTGTLVRRLCPEDSAEGLRWTLQGPDGQRLLTSRWLVLSGSLLTHRRCQSVFGWETIPLQQAAAVLQDPQLDQASGALAAIESTASSNLLLNLPPALSETWRRQPWRLLQVAPAAQQRWGLRRVSLQEQTAGRCAVVAESSPGFAARHRAVYGSRSAAAQLLGAAPEANAEAAVIEALDQAVQDALGLSTAGADRQLMRWGAAFPQPPGLPTELQLCPESRIGFCGDCINTHGFGRVEGAINSATALAAKLLPHL